MSFFNRNKNSDRYSREERNGGPFDNSSQSENLKEDVNYPSPKAIIYKSELDFMSRCILDYPNIETGGELFGFWTQLGTPVVLYVVGPGPNARHHSTAFVQDPEYVDNVEVKICNQTGLQHIGQWHSHHQLSLAHPSGGDVASMRRGVGQPGFPRMLLCIGNCTPTHTTVNAFNFHENTGDNYSHARWQVVDMESPFRPVINQMFQGRLYVPRVSQASHGEMFMTSPKQQELPSEPQYRQHWLTEKVENVETMKQFLKTAELIMKDADPQAEIQDSGEPLIAMFNGDLKIMLPYGFPKRAPRYIMINGADFDLNSPLNDDGEEYWESYRYANLDARFYTWLKKTIPMQYIVGESGMPMRRDVILMETVPTERDESRHQNPDNNVTTTEDEVTI